ncbi:UDP-glucose 4-epimerase GalE [Thalassobaculum litoreum]|uniref:UDP-glucose 4-epimerase n=1 Tax=Thalassobaculum litoreum DSM 18839 TaxID=1123362 RepID=A0A8G2BL99_9PROT|nr:UDP-glucose 4-epimerase GalE [Thalassobaculum litoreum]SDG36244.1 UDP-L-arabinose 4-epimerase [Thalassobaculum litoreum DSM 18839]
MADPVVLVTGGAGFVGSHACKALAAAGYRPVVYDDLSNGTRDAVRWGPIEVGDICDGQRLAEVVSRHRPVAALHFAARIDAAESTRHPARYYSTNVTGTRSLLQALRSSGVDVLVFSSTAAVYGDAATAPISEAHPLRPATPYGRSKLMMEDAVREASASHGLRYCGFRFFNAAGADPDGELREDHEPETHLIPRLLRTALAQHGSMSIYGTDYDTPDGTCVRDYVHVSDIADAHVLALRHLLAGKDDLIANLGSGRGYSVREVIAAVEETVGRPIPIREAARRTGDPAMLVADPTLAQRCLNWSSRRSSLEQIIADAARAFAAVDTGRERPRRERVSHRR